MTLPSPTGPRSVNGVGFFETSLSAFGDWLHGVLGEGWSASRPGFRDEAEAVESLAPADQRSHLCVGLSATWTALFNNARLGTDLGVLPTHAVKQLGCRSIRAVARDDGEERPPARILEVYGPTGRPPRSVERSIAVLRDGSRWVFETSGEPYEFEELAAYERPRKADRLTSDMVHRYLRALGVPIDDPVDWAGAVQISKAAPTS